MCGRYEGREKYGITVFAVILFLCSVTPVCTGQNLPDNIIRVLETQSEEGGNDTGALMEYLERLMSHPLQINFATDEQLEKIPVLSRFQISSLAEYRAEYGKILSPAELALVDGFDMNLVADILPFISFSTKREKGFDSETSKAPRHKVILRAKGTFGPADKEYIGAPYYRYARYLFESPGRMSAGITMENDVGEKNFPDFLSAFFQVRNLSIGRNVLLKSAVVGDYSVRAGQGLVLWNSFSITGLSSPSTSIKSESPVVPYTSSSEQDYFRGAAATFSFFRKVEASLYLSYDRVDARVDSLGYYSLPSDGLHDTRTLSSYRNTLGEMMAGARLSAQWKHVKVGVTSASYRFFKENKRKREEYNSHLMYDGWWGNAAVDALFSWRGYRAFMEAGVDYGGSFAALAGAILPVSSSLEISFIGRYYPKNFVSRFSGAFSSGSEANNEMGGMINGRWAVNRKVAITAYADFAYHPWMGYRTPPHSKVVKSAVVGEWTPSSHHRLEGKFAVRWRDYDAGVRFQGKVGYTYSGLDGWYFNSRVQSCIGVGSAFLVSQEVMYTTGSGVCSASLRSTIFHADEWEDRIYCYDRDLPGTFSVPAYYGRGFGLSLYIKVKPLKWLDLTIKGGWLKYTDKPEKDNLKIKGQVSLTF